MRVSGSIVGCGHDDIVGSEALAFLAVPISRLVQLMRIRWYCAQWTCDRVYGRPQIVAPIVLAGAGTIRFADEVTFGWASSPGFLSGYSFVEARNGRSAVSFGEGTHLNNGVTLMSEGTGIVIGRRCLIGPGVQVYDSDFHAVDPLDRRRSTGKTEAVRIGDDVFVGTNALILKGVQIGNGAVVGAGSVVTGDVPAGTVVAGNPARPIGS
jgi:acetyltransferase-like isoleucine patch superfamily enzyme